MSSFDSAPSSLRSGCLPETHHHRLLRPFAALLAGGMLAAAFPPLGWWPLAWLAFLPMLWALTGATLRQAAGRGYLMGLVFMAGVGLFTTSFGDGVLWMALLPWVLFVAIEALWFVPIAMLLSVILRARPWAVLAGVPSAWVLGEWARGAGPYGFPFGGLAVTALPTPLAQWSWAGGCYLVSGMAAFAGTCAFVLAARGRSGRRPAIAGLLALALAGIVGNEVRSLADLPDSDTPSLAVLVAQGDTNAPWGSPEADAAFDALCRRTLHAGVKPGLIVWSESAIPGPLLTDPQYRGAAQYVAAKVRAPLLTGAIQYAPDGSPCNTAVLIRPDKTVAGSYQKRTLVPFGEFVPGRHLLPFLNDFGVVERDEVPGRAYNVISDGSLKLGVPICFESASPTAARAFSRNGATLLAIITNDAWFPGYTGTPEMHLQEARLRAIETRNWVVRSAHTGISAVISPAGRVVSRLEAGRPGVLSSTVYPQGGETPYVRWGNWAVLASLASALLSAWAGMGRKTPAQPPA